MHTVRGTGVVARAWPQSHRSRLELAIAPSAVRMARQWTADQLARSRPPRSSDLIDSAVLAVSELVTNAIAAVSQAQAAAVRQAAATMLPLGDAPAIAARTGDDMAGTGLPAGLGRVSLVIRFLDDAVRIEVYDNSCIPLPPICQRDADDEHGRGLTVIAALAASWGWRPDARGKVVWCVLAGS
jgi:hypothetical protein